MKSFRSSILLSVSVIIVVIALATWHFVVRIDGKAHRPATIEQMRVEVICAAALIAVILALSAGLILAFRRRTIRELELKDAAIAASVTAIAFCDSGCRLTYVNRAFREMWGFGEDDELLGRQTVELWEYPEDAKAVTAAVLESGHWSGELIGRRKDGRTMCVRLTASLIPGRGGCGASLMGTFVDVTETRRAQRQQQAILDNIPDLVWLKDTESRFIAVNEAFARSCGSTPAALVGKNDLDVWPRDLAELYRQDDRLVMALRQRRRIEEALEVASGERRWIETIKTPVIDEGGNVVGTTGIARDIERRKRAEKALRESEERFRGLFEQNEDAIVLLRRESFEVLDANPAAERLFGYSRDELGRQSPWSFFTPEACTTFIRAVPPRGESAPFHLDRLGTARKSGEAIIVSIWGKIIRLRDEEVIYCSIRNITDRIRLEDEARNIQARLIHANKMTSLGILVSGIAHEINNPNTFIQGNAGILERIWFDVMPILARHRQSAGNVSLGGLPADEVERIVPRLLLGLREGSRRISAIVGNLKNFAREDRAAGNAPIDVNKIIRDAAMILSHHIHRHTDAFQLRLDDTLPPALGKAQQVEQVVINLIMNGLQALPGKEAGLTVATRVDRAAAVVITVRDEGEGMSGEVMARLTEPFFSTRLERGGTGLGLSICASIIQEHDGMLRFESAPGAGTTATVTLPLAPPGVSVG